MKLRIRITLLVATLLQMALFALPSSAQEVVWSIDFDFRFDNREYGNPSKMVVPSETIFGANITPEAGIAWGYGNSLMAGATLHADMGSESFFGKPEFIAYYHYSSSISPITASLGLFPRSQLRGRFSRATFDDTYNFFHPTIEGALFRYAGRYWYAELACDWNGLRSATCREKFTILFATEAQRGITYAGANLMLHHHAQSDTARGVTDNGLGNAYVGLDFSSLFDNTTLSYQASFLAGYQNDRYHIGTPEIPYGYEFTLAFQQDEVGLTNTFYKGDNLMPYWDLPYEDASGNIYGSSLYSGDPFYRVGESGFYNRLELYWAPELKDGVALRFSSVHHYDGAHWGWQQRIALTVDIGSDLFSDIN